ncbi:MAG: HAMP domain-containing histidine kinase [Lachnospiraceae bacterium]|nr:HAMP domain-containing histidine kinase [Lachnospiraceae bacterium]
MRILTNQKVRALFGQITLCLMVFIILSIILILSEPTGTVLQTEEITPGRWRTVMSITLCTVGIGIAVLAVCYRYFREQDRMMEEAVAQIREFIAGDRDARIECDEEGELYRLFHEINSLAAILNAKAESEEKSRNFLRNTISDISHQLKTPLAALNIYNGIMQTEAGANDPAAIKEFTDLSEQELDRIETLVQNLLKITKFDAGSVVMEKRTENISEMMEDVKKHFAFRAEQEGKEIVLSGSDSLSFLCDRNWIVEAVSNIVKNALDHTENGDRILIEWRESASVVRIAIGDNGTGIHPEDLHHIFKRFYRSRYSKDTQGIGLGLPLSKSVTEAHNGTIEVDSRPGEGTTFIMNFLVIPTKL